MFFHSSSRMLRFLFSNGARLSRHCFCVVEWRYGRGKYAACCTLD